METITSKSTDTSLTLASASYSLQISNFKSFKHNYIYTNDCTFDSSSVVVTNNFDLHTSSFLVNRDKATIAANGDDGTTEQPNGTEGYHIYLTSSLFDTSRSIVLSARGGNGLNRSSQEGRKDGGNGGNGGGVVLYCADDYSYALGMASVWLNVTEDQEKKDQRRAWVHHMQRFITTPAYLVNAVKKLADAIDTSDDFTDEKDAMVDTICLGLDGQSDEFMQSNTADITGGDYGVGSNGGLNGKSGQLGSVEQIRMTRKSIPKQSRIFVHPDQVNMTLRDIEDDYFLGSSESLLRCGLALAKLVERISFVDTLTEDAPLYQTYAQKEQELFILPSNSNVPTSVASLNESLKKAKNYAWQLSQGLDFYGHQPNWVPQGSFLLYKEDLDVILNDFTDIEDNYWDYKNKALSQQKRIDAINVGQSKANSIIQRTRIDLDYLSNDLVVTANLIAALSVPLPAKRTALLDAISKLSDKIQHAFRVPFGDFVDAAAMIAFAPGLPMAVIQGIGVIVKGKDGVSDDSGLKVEKDYLLNKIVGISGDLAGISEGLMLLNDGSYKIDDPGATKLTMEEKSLMDLIGQYRSLLGEDTLKDVKAKFDDFIDAVLTRNNAVIHYNANVVLYQQISAELDSQKRQLDILGRIQLETIDLELPSIAAFVQRSFFATTSRVLKMLYRTQRALAFYTLQPDSADLSSFRTGGFERKGIAAALKSAKVNIYDAYHNAIDGFTSQRQNFGYHSEGASGAPISIPLDEGQLETLKSKKGVIVAFTEAYPSTPKADNPFAGFADVRLSNVRVYLEGAKTGDGDLLVSIEHFGKDTMVNTMGEAYRFTHNPLYFKFQYALATGAILVDGDIEDVVAKEFAPPGPFSTWRIRISDLYNQSPDLSGVRKCWFEFSGSSRSFSS
ncbi:hypothetical protein AB1N83_007085 [Pleurotus pulmonarius]